ncbi:radical SAM protein [bacterium]|nr:radical SAM protein [bacterium]
MKAKIKPRINLENRTRLETVIPLSTLMILFVDPSSLCNFKCKFCPTGDHQIIRDSGRWQGLMDFLFYTKIIDDLKDFDKPLKVLRLYKEGEPLLNPRLADMVHYAKQSGSVQYIDTTTNGLLCDPERMKPILDAGLDKINISVNGMSSRQFLEFSGVELDFDHYVENIARLYDIKGQCEIAIKIAGDFLTEDEKERFYLTFGDIADRIFIENVAPCWPEFDVEDHLDVEITKGIYDQPLSDVNTCPYIFYMISVNSDGSVSLCFLDWSHKLLIGDVRFQSLKSIWDGEPLYRHQLSQLQGKRKAHAICGQCSQLSHCLPDNIDPYADELSVRLIASRQVLKK